MHGNGRSVVDKKSHGRSRVSNNATLWLNEEAIDGRSKVARRFRDILAEVISDIAQGDSSSLSEGQRQLARRCAMISTQCELLEARAVAGENFDIEVYGQLVDRLGRAFARIGLTRNVIDASPSLADILRKHAEADAKEVAEARNSFSDTPNADDVNDAHEAAE